ncbi:hypothetical protein JCM30760_26720 [Thiomicrorhabdus hydrogeniphila]
MQLSLFETTVLQGIHATGTTKGCYSHIENSLKTDMSETVQRGLAKVGKWQHRVRQIQQKLKEMALVDNGHKKGSWGITEKGRKVLGIVNHKIPKMYFQTAEGVAFWGDSTELTEAFIGQFDLIITSPPYLLTNHREYGHIGETEKDYVDGMVSSIEAFLPMLTPTASLVLNIGDSYKKGSGHLSLYKERLLIALEDKLGLHLVQNFVWYSPSKMPSGYWATRAKRDCVTSTENFYWLSLNPEQCKAKNQNVLVEYSENQKKYIEKAKNKSPISRKRPSGQVANEESFYQDNGGAIPSNLLFETPEGANSKYSQYCKEHGLPRHPAMYKYTLPQFFVNYLTSKGDVVFDPYSGSGNTALGAELSERHWVSCELAEKYVQGHYGRMLVNGLKPLVVK